MKNFVLLIALIIMSTVAQAAEIVVFERPSSSKYDIKARYSIDRSTDMVYIDLEIFEPRRRGESTSRSKHFRSTFNGLHYDQATSTIVLNHEGQAVECAKVATGSIFRWDLIRPTGCQLEAGRTLRVDDNGRKLYLEVVLKIK